MDLYKIQEIMSHISSLFDHYKENDAYFDEYLNGVLEHDLDKALSCFRDLINYLPRKRKNEQSVQKTSKKGINKPSKLCPLNRG